MSFRSLLALVVLSSSLVLAVSSTESHNLLNATISEAELYKCEAIKNLSSLKDVVEEGESPLLRQVFAWLFPFGPAWNSILGTFYISSVPNFILAFIPAEINADTLNTMTAFATGGLLSDVFLHLIPHAFMGEHQGSGVHFVMVEEKRNILIGLGIFVGFASFFFMEKTLRVLGGEEGGSEHSHSHSHSAEPTASKASGTEHSVSQIGLRSRKSEKTNEISTSEPDVTSNGPSKLSAYLNLFGDFVHNITDGLAMAASFYASPLIGATTTLACFAHEIPHEIADYSILIRSGFTKQQAMRSQFLTAIGAFVIPFVAGGFLYIGAVAVLPTLLAESKSGAQALRENRSWEGAKSMKHGLGPTHSTADPILLCLPADRFLLTPWAPLHCPASESLPATRPPALGSFSHSPSLLTILMGTKGRATPRVVCCAIPIARAAKKVLVVTSRKRPESWVLPKGGWEPSDVQLEAAASREALEEAGVRGTITRFVITIPTPATTYHFYELDVAALDSDWLEKKERRREWVDYAEACKRLEWKSELSQGLKLSSLAPPRSY
ncbi:hypothetical protein C0995_010738 [Termitomyces sp. Mi166|nr:hypothetical protein C0995_010738 [Termitomyces sp. Mi166\